MIKKLFSLLCISILFGLTTPSFANPLQRIQVTVKNRHTIHATIQRYERATLNSPWKKVGQPFAGVVGRNGVTSNKKEGDGKTPLGSYPISGAFGFSKTAKKLTQLSYLPITQNTVCVDDLNSRYYNQIIDRSRVSKPDWQSAEIMSQFPKQYQLGLILGYNQNPIVPGKSSCIFMHVWDNPDEGTAGCIATSKTNMQRLFLWLRPNAIIHLRLSPA